MRNDYSDESRGSFLGNDTTKTLLTLAAGAVAGAVTALLLAPQSGSETRRTIGQAAAKAKSSIGETLQAGMDKINSLRGGENGEAGMDDMSAGSDMMGGSGRRQSRGNSSSTGLGSTGTPGTTGRSGQGSMGNV